MRIWLIAATLFCATTASAAELRGDLRGHNVTVASHQRSYAVYVPQGYQSAQPMPLVMAFHGGDTNPAFMMTQSGFNALADELGFLVVYPAGSGRDKDKLTWNAGDCCGYASVRRIDDVAFVKALLVDAAKRYAVDSTRIYATGISNGGMLAYRLSCEMDDVFAAIAPVAATLAIEPCRARRSAPLLHIHGLLDDNVPFEGGSGSDSKTKVQHRSVPDTLKVMRDLRACAASYARERLRSNVEQTTWSCGRGGPVVLTTIDDGGHAWPGGINTKPQPVSIPASRTILEFFARYRKN